MSLFLCALSAAEVAQITSGDLDNDGFFDWQDCDDTDPNITIGPSGATDSCPGVDCSQILADGYSR